MPPEVSLTVGSFPRQLNKKPSCYLVHGAVAAEEGVSGLSVVSVLSAALLTSTVPEIHGRPFFRLSPTRGAKPANNAPVAIASARTNTDARGRGCHPERSEGSALESATCRSLGSCYAAAAMSRARPLAAILSHCQPTVIVTASAIVG